MNHKVICKKDFDLIVHEYNIVLITITTSEFRVVYSKLRPIKIDNETVGFLEYTDASKQTFILGTMGLYPVMLTKILDVGMTGQHTVGNMIQESLRDLPVNYVLMIGICATTDIKKMPIGSVIISKEIIAYERIKYSTVKKGVFTRVYLAEHLIDRAPRYYPGISLKSLDLFLGKQSFQFKVEKGAILSGEKLISSKSRLYELKRLFPNAIALEMEGVGFASALHSVGINDWVIIKGVSDDAINKSSHDNQESSMNNVMELIEVFFNQPGLFDAKIKVETLEEKTRKSVLISGSYPPSDPHHSEVEELAYDLSKELVRNNFRIITGYGLTVGPAIIAGAYQKACDMRKELNEVLDTFPFPRVQSETILKYVDAIKEENRNAMVKEAGIAVFLYGKKVKSRDGTEQEVRATGVWDEFVRASKRGLLCIPLGSTGYIAEEIWNHINEDFGNFYPASNTSLRDDFNKLNNKELTKAQKVESIIRFIKSALHSS